MGKERPAIHLLQVLGVILSFVPALALILYIDAHHASLFGTAKYQVVAAQLLANQSYEGDIDFDERALQKRMAQRLPSSVETLIAGSSRTMQLTSPCFAGGTYNASVSGAMISDLAAIVEEFRRGRQLKTVVFAADPWMLNAHEQAAAWTTSPAVPNLIRLQAAPDWIRAQLRLGLTPHFEDVIAAARATFEPLRELLDPATFHAALAPPASPHSFIKAPDGSLTYPPSYLKTDTASVLQSANEHLAQTYSGFDRVDPFLAHAFRSITQDLEAHGTHVILVLTPFHPLYYERTAKFLEMAEAYYHSLPLEIKGTYKPQPASDFLDAVHLTKQSLSNLYDCPRPVLE